MMPARPSDGDTDISRRLEWTLRIGAFLCFVGHGAFGLMTKEAWVRYFAVAGIGREAAFRLMPVVGALDVVMGCLMLWRPRPIVSYWMIVWAMWTAVLRPLSGEPFWEALERAGNYGIPVALVVWMATPRDWQSLVGPARFHSLSTQLLGRLRWALALTVALLMCGHGALGVIGKQGLVSNYASVFSPATAAAMTPDIGWLEIVAAIGVLIRPAPWVLLGMAVWKLATEALFVMAGASAWEVVERGGSYAAPVALALVVIALRGRRTAKRS
jgi:hypothetical protein